MNQDVKDQLTKPYDDNIAKVTKLNDEINAYNLKHGKIHPSAPSIIPRIDTDEKQREIAEIMDKIQKRSLKKQDYKKKRIKLIIKSIAMASLAVVVIQAGIPVIEKGIKSIQRDKELKAAVTYMDENYMPYIYDISGFQIIGRDDKGKLQYSYNSGNINKAVDNLIEIGLDRNEAILLLQELTNGNAFTNEYFRQLKYVSGDKYDQEAIPPSVTFKNMNEVALINKIKGIQNGTVQRKMDVDKQPYLTDFENTNEEGAKSARS